MFVTFIGNPKDKTDSNGRVEYCGIEFPLNIAVEVEDRPPFSKLKGNRHFKVREGVEAEQVKETSPIDTTKADLIAFAEEHGIKIDKRWSVEKITKAIDDAAAAASQGDEDEI